MRLDREERVRSFLVVLLLLAVLTLACSDSGSGSSSSSSQADIGDEVRLHWGKVDYVFVAVDRDANDELSEVASSRDGIGMNILLTSGRVFLVDDGSKVLVIDRDSYIVKVRILEGPHYGRAGWVVHEAVD